MLPRPWRGWVPIGLARCAPAAPRRDDGDCWGPTNSPTGLDASIQALA